VTPIISRALALGLLAIIIAGTAAALTPLVSAWSETGQDDAEQVQRLLTGYQKTIAARPALQAQLADLKRREAQQPGLYPGATAALATAALQADMRRLIQAGGGDIRSTQELAAAPEGNFERLSVRFDLALPLAALPNWLTSLEGQVPYLFADKIEVTAPETPGHPVLLTIRCTVHAYRRTA